MRRKIDSSLDGAIYLEHKQYELEKIVEDIELEEIKKDNLLNELEKHQIDLEFIKEQYCQVNIEKEASLIKLKELQNSRSWRITQLLRKIKTIIRRNDSSYNQNGALGNPSTIKSKQEHKRIRELKEKLYVLGFEERALKELHDIVDNNSLTKSIRNLAVRQLVVWYSNRMDKNNAQKCIELLDISLDGVHDINNLCNTFIIKAECYKVLGDIDQSKREIAQAFFLIEDANMYLVACNFEPSINDRIKWINKALQLFNIPAISLDRTSGQTAYDCLKVVDNIRSDSVVDQPKVTVIMPVFNAASVIRTALESVLAQTWGNLEVIIVDDCSTDATIEIIEEFLVADPRIILIKADSNRGAYTVRNIALKIATGEFVTCHDADDWSHPLKVEVQAKHLLTNPEYIANTSQAARATEDLMFYRKGKLGNNIFPNISSLMFRRKKIMDKIGFWDSVRFSADSEFIHRIQKVYGKESVSDLQTGPLSLPRISMNSLTSNSSFGINGNLAGARRYYKDSYLEFHNNSMDLRYDFPQLSRPFYVVEPMEPIRKIDHLGSRAFDIVFVSDFRQSEAVLRALDDINLSVRRGLRVGLVQMYSYELKPTTILDPLITELINHKTVEFLVYGENISCDYLIVRNSSILQDVQKYIPNISTKDIHIIIENEIFDNNTLLDINRCNQNLHNYFGNTGTWHPISPDVRSQYKDCSSISLAEDWAGINKILNNDDEA